MPAKDGNAGCHPRRVVRGCAGFCGPMQCIHQPELSTAVFDSIPASRFPDADCTYTPCDVPERASLFSRAFPGKAWENLPKLLECQWNQRDMCTKRPDAAGVWWDLKDDVQRAGCLDFRSSRRANYSLLPGDCCRPLRSACWLLNPSNMRLAHQCLAFSQGPCRSSSMLLRPLPAEFARLCFMVGVSSA